MGIALDQELEQLIDGAERTARNGTVLSFILWKLLIETPLWRAAKVVFLAAEGD